jgi:hypothetical protein
MTTGRINQVTILSRRAKAPRQTPRRERVVPSKRHRSAQSRHSIKANSSDSVCDRFNCPHWVPQKLVRNETWPTLPSKSISATYSPQEEKTHASTRWKRIRGRVVPKDLVNFWQSQQSTDPKRCPPENWRDFGSSYKHGRKTKRFCCLYLQGGVAEALRAQLSYLSQRLTREQGEQVRNLIGHKARVAENGSPKSAGGPTTRARSATAAQISWQKRPKRVLTRRKSAVGNLKRFILG